MVSNILVDSRLGRLLTIDELEQVQRQRIASLIGHIFQLAYANMVGELIQEEKLNRCYSAPSQRQHSCLMIDKEDSLLYYREDVVEKIDLNAVLNNFESVCNALGFKLGQSWKMYVMSEIPKCFCSSC